jgi:hypothetical protein
MRHLSALMLLVVTLLAALLAFSVPAAQRQKQIKLAAPLPAPVVAAWKKAGGALGTSFLSKNGDGSLGMASNADGSDTKPTDEGEIPGFSFSKWQNGVTSRLRQPQSPFGLILFEFTEADLTDLACLKNLQRLSFLSSSITGAGFKDLAGLEILESLEIIDTSIDDAGLKELAKLKALRTLRLIQRENITETGLKELARPNRLEVLNINSVKMTDEVLRQLTELKEIRDLHIASPVVTSAGLRELAALKNLRRLGLAYTRVTDADVEVLAELTGLEELDIGENPVTAAGLAQLQKALPNLRIVRSPDIVLGSGAREGSRGAEDHAGEP